VEARIQEAIADSDVDVKVTALELGEDRGPANEPALARLAAGVSGVKAVAFGAYLGLADARPRADRSAEAMYLRVLGASKEPGDLKRSLIGLGNVGNPEPAKREREVRATLVQARIRLRAPGEGGGEGGEKDRAVDMLLGGPVLGRLAETVQLALAG